MFTTREREYLNTQRLARLATIDASGQPDADAVGFELDGDTIVIGSYRDLTKSRKYRNVAGGNTKVSLIVDSLAPVDPMEPQAVKVHGVASIERRDGRFGAEEYLVIRPTTTWSWGIEGPTFVDGVFRPRRTNWT